MAVLLRTQSDERLVALARAGHERAFEVIVQRYRGLLLRSARRYLSDARAEDAVQQAFLAAWSALQRGDEVRDLRPWLYRIVHNTALNALRAAGYDYAELPEGLAMSVDEVERREDARDALSGLAALPERQREALLRVAVEGRPQGEVARELGVSEGAVRQLVHRARLTLRAAATAVVPLPLASWAAGATRRERADRRPGRGARRGRRGERAGGEGRHRRGDRDHRGRHAGDRPQRQGAAHAGRGGDGHAAARDAHADAPPRAATATRPPPRRHAPTPIGPRRGTPRDRASGRAARRRAHAPSAARRRSRVRVRARHRRPRHGRATTSTPAPRADHAPRDPTPAATATPRPAPTAAATASPPRRDVRPDQRRDAHGHRVRARQLRPRLGVERLRLRQLRARARARPAPALAHPAMAGEIDFNSRGPGR